MTLKRGKFLAYYSIFSFSRLLKNRLFRFGDSDSGSNSDSGSYSVQAFKKHRLVCSDSGFFHFRFGDLWRHAQIFFRGIPQTEKIFENFGYLTLKFLSKAFRALRGKFFPYIPRCARDIFPFPFFYAQKWHIWYLRGLRPNIWNSLKVATNVAKCQFVLL